MPFVSGLDQRVDQRGGRGEADRQTPLAGGETETECDMGLVGSEVSAPLSAAKLCGDRRNNT